MKKQIRNIEYIQRQFDTTNQHNIHYDVDNYYFTINKYDRNNELLESISSESIITSENSIRETWRNKPSCIGLYAFDMIHGTDSEYEKENISIEYKFNIKETGSYRIDFLYGKVTYENVENESTDFNTDFVYLECYVDDTKIESSCNISGHDTMINRSQYYTDIMEGSHTLKFICSYNTRIYGLSIRKYDVYTGGKGSDYDLLLKDCDIKLSENVTADELEMTISYHKELKEETNPSGYLFDYKDEINFFIWDRDNNKKQVFGGYISSPVVDLDNNTMDLHCKGRLGDGLKRIMMTQIQLLSGTTDETAYENTTDTHRNFTNKGELLNFICNCYEIPLKHENIENNNDFNQVFVKKWNYKPNEAPEYTIENWNNGEPEIIVNQLDDCLQLRNSKYCDETTSSVDESSGNYFQQFHFYNPSSSDGYIEISPNNASNFWIEYGLKEAVYTLDSNNDTGNVSVDSYGNATATVRQLADMITTETGYNAVQPIYDYLQNKIIYPSHNYSNFVKSADSLASDIINNGSCYCNCCDRSRLCADILSYKGVPNIWYLAPYGHVYLSLEDYGGVSGEYVMWDINYSRNLGQVYNGYSHDVSRKSQYPDMPF